MLGLIFDFNLQKLGLFDSLNHLRLRRTDNISATPLSVRLICGRLVRNQGPIGRGRGT